MCGENTGQHIYIPVESPRSRPMMRMITDGRLGNDDTFTTQGYKFRIKIRQIDCISNDNVLRQLRAPEGCLQYHTQRQGTISSFNWSPTIQRQYYPNQHYSICFRRTASDCRLQLFRSKAAPPYSTSVGRVPQNSIGMCSFAKFSSFFSLKKTPKLHIILPHFFFQSCSRLRQRMW